MREAHPNKPRQLNASIISQALEKEMYVYSVRMLLCELKHGVKSQRNGAILRIHLSLSASECHFRNCVITVAARSGFLFPLAFALIDQRNRSAPPTRTC